MRNLAYLFVALLLLPSCTESKAGGIMGAYYADYCGAATWPIVNSGSASLWIDFDYTGDTDTACTDDGTSNGILSGATIGSPPATEQIAGGSVMDMRDDGDFIAFGNSTNYANGLAGEAIITFMYTTDGAAIDRVSIINVDSDDRIRMNILSTEQLSVSYEEGGASPVVMAAGYPDLSALEDEWIRVHLQWDSTNCTDGNGNCGEEVELRFRYQWYDTGDSRWEDGAGSPGWSSYYEEADTDDMQGFDSTMQDDDLILGDAVGTTTSHDVYIGTFEISDAADPFD